MRISSLLATTSIAVALTTTTFALGARNAEPALVLTALPVDKTPTDQGTAVTPTPEATSAPAQSGTTGATENPAPTQTNTAAAAPAEQAPATTQAPVEPAPAPAPAATPIAHASDVISYKYGDVQVEVVKLGSEITDVNLLVGDATYGRDVAYQTLIQATIQNQGTNYGNYTGATFTTDAFKKAVENALSKF